MANSALKARSVTPRRTVQAATPSPLLEQAVQAPPAPEPQAPEPEPTPAPAAPTPAPEPEPAGSEALAVAAATAVLTCLKELGITPAPASSSPLGWGTRARRSYFIGTPQGSELDVPLYAWDANANAAVAAPDSGFTGKLEDLSVETSVHETYGERSKLVISVDLGPDTAPIRLRCGLSTNVASQLCHGIISAGMQGFLGGPLSISFRFGQHESGKVVLASLYSGGTWIDPRLAYGSGEPFDAVDAVAMAIEHLSLALGGTLPSQARAAAQADAPF